MTEIKKERLNKYLAQCGLCSRRDADSLIEKGKVCVNGIPANMGLRVSDADHITVGGKPVNGKEEKVVLAYYKPVGVTCSQRDSHAKILVKDCIDYKGRVTYAGRLDKDSEGLLLMTNDGELIDAMMRGANGHEKEYVVKVNKEITKSFIDGMAKAMYLEELGAKTRPCQTKQEGKYTFRIILTQGINRQIRRMAETLGYRVMNLKRERVMNVSIGNMRPGQYRVMYGAELDKLYEGCGMNK